MKRTFVDRGGRDAGITQPRDYSLAAPVCIPGLGHNFELVQFIANLLILAHGDDMERKTSSEVDFQVKFS